MRFGNPYALWGLLFIPIIILMYILKQNYEEKQVASTYLWDLATKEDEVNTPWQRLKKNLLMVLQILTVLLLVIAFSNPYIYRQDIVGRAEVIVIDNSGSMTASYEGSVTRLDYAKKSASNLVDALMDHTPVTLITVGQDVSLLLSGEDDKEKIKKAIRSIKASYGSDAIASHLPFIQSIAESYDAYGMRVYSDVAVEGEGIHTLLVNRPDTNVSLDYITSYLKDDGNIEVLAKVTNRYAKPVTISLGIYSEEDNLLQGIEVTLEPHEKQSLLFDRISYDGQMIYGEINNVDLIQADNRRYAILSKEQTKRILLVSEGNIFLEKSILATGRYELFKTNTSEIEGDLYDLYIFDGIRPIKLPSQGSLLFLNLQTIDGFYETTEEKKSGLVTFQELDMTKYIKDEKFVVSSYLPIDEDTTLTTIARVGNDSIMSIGNRQGQKYGIIGFDIHNSDFPINMSFPVVMDRLLGKVLGDGTKQKELYYPGDHIAFEPLSTTVKAYMINPSGEKERLKITYPTTYYDKTGLLGTYQLIQVNEKNEEIKNHIVVGYNTERESLVEDINITDNQQVTEATDKRDVKKDLMKVMIILAILLSLYEWKKYVRG